MATIKLDVPYFAWREGRPRWVPGPKLRAQGWKGRDLKDEAGQFLPLQAALEAARELNREVAAAGVTKAPRPPATSRTLVDLVEAYLKSDDFGRLAEPTQATYRNRLNAIRFRPTAAGKEPRRELIGLAPVRALGKPEVKAFFERLHKERGLIMARHVVMLISAAWTWGTMSTAWRLGPNPCHRLRLPSPEPRVRVATETEIRALEAAAAALGRPSVGDAIYLALFTGQRQTDVLLLADPFGSNRTIAERAAAGEAIQFKQSKTGVSVEVYATPQLLERLVAMDKRRRALKVVPAALVVAETTGRAYGNPVKFRAQFRAVRALAIAGDPERGLDACPSLKSFTFRDLRDTAVTWLARAGATVPEICSMTGHTLESATNVLKHYLQLDPTLAREANRKLVIWLEAQGVRL